MNSKTLIRTAQVALLGTVMAAMALPASAQRVRRPAASTATPPVIIIVTATQPIKICDPSVTCTNGGNSSTSTC